MTLVDTSVWIEHFKKADAGLLELMSTERVFMHPMVLGELSLSPFRGPAYEMNMRRLASIEALDSSADAEVLALIERFKLWGRGIGWADCHLMAAAREADCHLLTRDKALRAAWIDVRPKD